MGVRDRIPIGLRRRALRLLPGQTWPRIRAVLNGETATHAAVRSARISRHERVRGSHPGTGSVIHEGRLLTARVHEPFDGEAVRRDNLAVVAEILQRAGVDGLLLEEGPSRRSVIVVPARLRDQVCRAVRQEDDRTLHVLCGPRARPTPAGRVGTRSCRADQWVLFRLRAGGQRVLDVGDLGCAVQFWPEAPAGQVDSGGDRLPQGTLLAPVKNRWVDHIRPHEWAAAPRGEDGLRRLTLTEDPHVDEVTFPVDVVYTWVDGDDPEWLRRKAAALGDVAGESRHSTAANESRYQDHDELRYSMRSVEMYASWVRHVYLVTDGQVPPWLDVAHPKVTVVDHREVFSDTTNLPTFNSHAIEAQLQNIDGLSEHFLYMNDDVFLGRPVAPALFFTPHGSTRFFPSTAKLGASAAQPDEAPVMTAAKNNRDLLRGRFGRTFTNKMKHVPHALRRSLLQEMQETFPEAYQRTAAQRFRSPRDHAMVSSLYHWYAYLTDRAQPGTIRYYYTDINHHAAPRRLRGLAARRDVDVFCLNDHAPNGVATAEGRRALRDFLEEVYPVPSSFERDG